MRYGGELRIRIIGDPERAMPHLGRARVLMGLLLNQMQLSGNKVGHRRISLPGVEFRLLVAGGVPIVEIDVAGETATEQAFGTLLVWPSDASDLHAFGENPQVLLQHAGEQWRAAFYDADARPVETPGAFYAGTFPDGLTHFGNIDWTSGDGRWSVSWYGPRARYFMGRSRTEDWIEFPAERPYGEFQFRAGVYMKGRLLIDVETVSEALIDEADVYIKGAAVQVHDGVPYLFVIAAKFGGENTLNFDFEYDIAEWVLRFRLSPQDSLAPIVDVVADSGVVLGSRVGIGEWNAEHPWCFNADGTAARTLRAHDSEDFSVLSIREIELVVGFDSAAWNVVETIEIPKLQTNVETETVSDWSTHPTVFEYLRVTGTNAEGRPTGFEKVSATQPLTPSEPAFYFAFPHDWTTFACAPESGSGARTVTTTRMQGRAKCAVDWRDGWVYAYTLGARDNSVHADVRSRSLSVSDHPRIVGWHTETVTPDAPEEPYEQAFIDEAITQSTGSISRTIEGSITGRFGGIETPDTTVESAYSATYAGQVGGEHDWVNVFENPEGMPGPLLLLGDLESNVEAAASGEVSETRACVLFLDLRHGLLVTLERVVERAYSSSLSYSYSGPASDHLLDGYPAITMPATRQITTNRHFRYIVRHGSVVLHTANYPEAEEASGGAFDVTAYPRLPVPNIGDYLPGTVYSDTFPAELRTWVWGTSGRENDQSFILDVPPSGPTQQGAAGWQYLRFPYFDRYEHVLASQANQVLIEARADHDGVAHYGAAPFTPTGKFVWSFAFAAAPLGSAPTYWQSQLSGGDLPLLAGRDTGTPFAPAAYVPPTTFE